MEDGPGNLPVVHQHGDAPADSNDKGHAQKIRAARHIGLGNLLFAHTVDEPDKDAAHQEQGAELREPPAQDRQKQAHLVKGDDAVNHHQEGQGEEEHDDLPPGGEFHRLGHIGLELPRAHADDGPGGILFYFRGVGHDKPDGGALKDQPLEEPEQDAVPQGDPGEARRDARGKGVDGGADDPRPGPQEDDGDAHHRVIARRQENGNQQGEEGHGLLPHAICRSPKPEGQHQDGDHPLLPAAQALDDAAHPGVHGPRLHHHAQKAPYHQDKDADVHRVIEPGEGGLQHRSHALGAGGHGVVGPGHRHLVHIRVGPCRDQPGGKGHQDDEQEQDGVGRGHTELCIFQRVSPLFTSRW